MGQLKVLLFFKIFLVISIILPFLHSGVYTKQSTTQPENLTYNKSITGIFGLLIEQEFLIYVGVIFFLIIYLIKRGKGKKDLSFDNQNNNCDT